MNKVQHRGAKEPDMSLIETEIELEVELLLDLHITGEQNMTQNKC